MRRRSSLLGGLWMLLLAMPFVASCSSDAEDCELTLECRTDGTGGTGTGGTGTGGTGTGGAGATGAGGAGAQGGGAGCDGDADCSLPGAGKCDGGECVPCDDSAQCTEADAGVCESGECVECSLADESGCVLNETCDLLAQTCVGVAEQSVQTCGACTNDVQCAAGHRCIPMDFDGSPHGYYCLEEAAPTCEQPYAAFINQPSINGAAAVNYCGIEEDLATCEVVLALLANWRCTGTDGMCSELMGGVEQAVPGALCRQVGALANRCTYGCGTQSECPSTGAPSTCGDGDMTPPGWCGG